MDISFKYFECALMGMIMKEENFDKKHSVLEIENKTLFL